MLPKRPEAEKALVYVVRPFLFLGMALTHNIYLDDTQDESKMGSMRTSQYIYFYVSPGRHTLYVDAMGVSYTSFTISPKAGETIFLKVSTGFPAIDWEEIKSDVTGKYLVKNASLGTVVQERLASDVPPVSVAPPLQSAESSKSATVKKASLVLMPIITAGGVPHDEIAGYEAALSESLSIRYQVLSGQKVVDTVNQIYQNRSAETQEGKDCDETKCIQDVAIAFQSELVAVANITKKEGGYFLSLKILNVIEDKVVFSKSIPCKGCDSFKVMEVLQTIAGGEAAISSSGLR